MVSWEILTTCCCSGQLIHKIVPRTAQPYAERMPSSPAPSTPPRRLPCQRGTCTSARKGLAAGAATVLTLPSWNLAALRCNQAPPIRISLRCLGRQSLAKALEGRKKSIKLTCCSQFIRCSSFKTPDKTCFHSHFKTLCISPAIRHWDGSLDKGWAACRHTLAIGTSACCCLSDCAALSNDA